MASGWIKIHRSLLDWEWYDNQQVKCVFLHLLLKANFEPKKWHGITVERGQIVTSLELLSVETGLSVQTVRTVISKLKSTGELTSKSTNKFTILTICNYDTYQDENFETNTQTNTQTNKQLTNNQQTTNKQLTTTKEYKEDNNIRIKEDNKENNSINGVKKENQPKFNFKKKLLELGVDEAVADEWIAIRKLKKKTNSEYALSREIAQVEKAGITMAEALTICCDNGWGQFKAEWLGNLIRSQVNRQTQRGGGFMTDAEAQAICDAGMKLHEFIGRNRQ